MSKDTTNVVRDVIHRLMKLINSNNGKSRSNSNVDVSILRHENDEIVSEKKEGLTRSCTDLYIADYKPRTFVPSSNVSIQNAKLNFHTLQVVSPSDVRKSRILI